MQCYMSTSLASSLWTSYGLPGTHHISVCSGLAATKRLSCQTGGHLSTAAYLDKQSCRVAHTLWGPLIPHKEATRLWWSLFTTTFVEVKFNFKSHVHDASCIHCACHWSLESHGAFPCHVEVGVKNVLQVTSGNTSNCASMGKIVEVDSMYITFTWSTHGGHGSIAMDKSHRGQCSLHP